MGEESKEDMSIYGQGNELKICADYFSEFTNSSNATNVQVFSNQMSKLNCHFKKQMQGSKGNL